MQSNYTLVSGKDIYLNENLICFAGEKDGNGYITFTMASGDVIVAKPK